MEEKSFDKSFHVISAVELSYLLACASDDAYAGDWSASVPPELRAAAVERMVTIGLVAQKVWETFPQQLTEAGRLYVNTILSTPLPKATTRWEIPARPAVSTIKERQT
jgi:hypothetical protein